VDVELAKASSERGELMLRRRDDGALELRVNGVFVMDPLETTTERELAHAALEQVEEPREVLVGGLGLGFTAHEVLADPRVERVAVVEIEEALVRWMRDGTVPHGPQYLADERLTVVVADLRQAIGEASPESYDLVLLDIDNGPDNLVHEGNAEVYTGSFLSSLRGVLRPGGALAVWSSTESGDLEDALRGVFGDATALPYDVRLQERDERYWLYVARR
jgi:spermidine synthase